MVKHVGGAFGEEAVALGVGVGAKAKEHFAGVVDVHIVIHDHEVLGEHHLAHAPKAVHDFVSLHRVGFTNADEDQIVENALGGKRDVHDFREVHLEDRQEQLHRGAAQVEVLHGRMADDRGGIHRLFAMRDGGDVEHRVGSGSV